MPKLSKSQKKYIDQAQRRLEAQFKKYNEKEAKIAEKTGTPAPVANIPTRAEIYEKIDVSNGRNDYAEQIARMSSVKVYQSKARETFESRYGLSKTQAGYREWNMADYLSIEKAALTGYNAEVRRIKGLKMSDEEKKKAIDDVRYKTIKNIYLYTPGRTEEAVKRTKAEETTFKDKIYVENFEKMLEKELKPKNEALYNAIKEKLDATTTARGRHALLKKIAKEGEKRALDRAGEGTEAEKKKTIDNLRKVTEDKEMSGLKEVIGYDAFRGMLLDIVGALGLDLEAEYDGATVEEISRLVMGQYNEE